MTNAPRALPVLLAVTVPLALAAAPVPPPPAARPLDFARVSSAGREIEQVELARGIYQFTTLRDAYVRQLNTVVIVNQDDVLVFDTNTRPSSARLILGEIRKLTDKPVRTVVNSHHHPDHWSGNEVYLQAFPGLEIVATEEAARLMHSVANLLPARFTAELERRQAAFQKEVAAGKQEDGSPLTSEQRRQDEDDLRNYRSFVDESLALRRTFPTLTYVDRLTLHRGKREIRLLSVTGDAEGTTVLYLPQEKILVTGDAVSYPVPYVSARPSLQIDSLRALAAIDAELIIPGHGPAFRDRQFLFLEIELIEAVREGVHAALQQGLQTLEAVQKAVLADELREKFAHGDADTEARFRERVRFLVKVAIREEGQDFQ